MTKVMFQVTRCLTYRDVNKLRLFFGQRVRVRLKKLNVTHTVKINKTNIALRLMNMEALFILPVYINSTSELDITLQSYFVSNCDLTQPGYFIRTEVLTSWSILLHSHAYQPVFPFSDCELMYEFL